MQAPCRIAMIFQDNLEFLLRRSKELSKASVTNRHNEAIYIYTYIYIYIHIYIYIYIERERERERAREALWS